MLHTSSCLLTVFKSKLKTHIFRQTFRPSPVCQRHWSHLADTGGIQARFFFLLLLLLYCLRGITCR